MDYEYKPRLVNYPCNDHYVYTACLLALLKKYMY